MKDSQGYLFGDQIDWTIKKILCQEIEELGRAGDGRNYGARHPDWKKLKAILRKLLVF